LAVCLAAGAAAQEGTRVATRYGVVAVDTVLASDSTPLWRLRFQDCVLVELEYDRLDIEEIVPVGEHDDVLVRRSTGGIACPFQFLVLEVAPGGRTRLSPEFGSCLEPARVWRDGEALVLEMPAYIPHPELLTRQERRRRRRTTEIYRVQAGVVTESASIERIE
jgi:hypothetical protein